MQPVHLSRRHVFTAAAVAAFAAACAGKRSAPPTSGPTATMTTPTTSPTPSAVRPASVAMARELVHGPRTSHNVALTFHGAGDVSLARQLLSEAERAGAHVTV